MNQISNSRTLARNGRIVGEVMSGAADDYLRYFLGVEDMCIPYNNKKVSGRVSICHPDDGRSRENQTSMLQTYSCRETRGNIMERSNKNYVTYSNGYLACLIIADTNNFDCY